MSTSQDQMAKNEHLQLAGVIKSVHKQLRRQFRESDGDYSSVWNNHLKNKDTLLSYAQAMKSLAVQHWAVYPETRIDWCHKVIVEYFLRDGWKKALEKDAKRRYFEQKRRMQLCCEDNSDGGKSSFQRGKRDDVGMPVEDFIDQEHVQIASMAAANVTSLDGSERMKHLPLSNSNLSRLASYSDEKIRLLDVGSCYNAFQVFDKFDSVGIDLCPADESVYQCDFLELQITPAKDGRGLLAFTSPVMQMPAHSFHAVVFSLLLEYLPSPDQRHLCCVKAHSLLDMHGLLLVVTPDSHSQHRNAPMMKSWKIALESLGFSRWKYEKKEHIHCMAFRKVSEITEDFSDAERRKEAARLLHIPQDFNDACYEDEDLNPKPTKVDDEDASSDDFVITVEKELPFFALSDDDGSIDEDKDNKYEDDKNSIRAEQDARTRAQQRERSNNRVLDDRSDQFGSYTFTKNFSLDTCTRKSSKKIYAMKERAGVRRMHQSKGKA